VAGLNRQTNIFLRFLWDGCDFTYNQLRKFVVITSSADGNTVRIDLVECRISSSMANESESASDKRFFKDWRLSLNISEVHENGSLLIELIDPNAKIIIRLGT